MKHLKTAISAFLMSAIALHAALVVQISEVKRAEFTGKAVFKLTIKNTFSEPVKSAHAWIFLNNAKGTVVGVSSCEVVGTKAMPVLFSDQQVSYMLPVAYKEPYASNVVLFSRTFLSSGKPIDPKREVEIER